MPTSREYVLEWNKIGAWTRCQRVARGGYSQIFLGSRNSDDKIFAVKSVFFVPDDADANRIDAGKKDIEEWQLAGLVNEIRTLKKLKSPYIARYIGCGTSEIEYYRNGPEKNRLLLDLYLEYYPHGSLTDVVEKYTDVNQRALPEAIVRAYTRDVLHGLNYLHTNKLVHGDIKLANIVIGNGVCKILDFGSAKDIRTSSIWKVLLGTATYMPKEQKEQRSTLYESDIFCLGACALEMATGTAPTDYRTAPPLRPGQKPPPVSPYGNPLPEFSNRKIPGSLSPEMQSFLSKCLHPEPSNRWSAKQLLDHDFIRKKDPPDFNPYPRYKDNNGKLLKRHEQIISPQEMIPLQKQLLLSARLLSICAPLSPIPTVPTKRRRGEFEGACCQSISDSDVITPGQPPQDGEETTEPPWYGPKGNNIFSDEDSGTEVEKYPRDKDGKYARPSSRERMERKRRATVSTRPHPLDAKKKTKARQKNAAHSKRHAGPEGQTSQPLSPSSSSHSDATSTGSAQYLPPANDEPVAKVTVDEGDEPLVVQICREFEIPLPRESLYMTRN